MRHDAVAGLDDAGCVERAARLESGNANHFSGLDRGSALTPLILKSTASITALGPGSTWATRVSLVADTTAYDSGATAVEFAKARV